MPDDAAGAWEQVEPFTMSLEDMYKAAQEMGMLTLACMYAFGCCT